MAATFIERPNRFVAYVDIDGTVERVHVPDPGRLKELMIPGTPVFLEDSAGGAGNGNRKTRYSLLLIASPDRANWVSLNTQLPNRVVRLMLEQRLLPQFEGYVLTKPEFSYGQSRFDFLLTSEATDRKRLLEVKSVTLVLSDKTAKFPDAPTTRGTRHLRELIHAVSVSGYEASVLFVVQRPDALRVCPNRETDPAFCEAVADAMAAGVDFSAICYDLSPAGIVLSPRPLIFQLSPLS